MVVLSVVLQTKEYSYASYRDNDILVVDILRYADESAAATFKPYMRHHIDEYEGYLHIYVQIKKDHLQFIRTHDGTYYLAASIKAPVIEPNGGFYVKFANGDFWKMPETQIAIGPTSYRGSTLGYITDFGFTFSGTSTTPKRTYMVSVALTHEEVEHLKENAIIGFKIGNVGRYDFTLGQASTFKERVNNLMECDYYDTLKRSIILRGAR